MKKIEKVIFVLVTLFLTPVTGCHRSETLSSTDVTGSEISVPQYKRVLTASRFVPSELSDVFPSRIDIKGQVERVVQATIPPGALLSEDYERIEEMGNLVHYDFWKNEVVVHRDLWRSASSDFSKRLVVKENCGCGYTFSTEPVAPFEDPQTCQQLAFGGWPVAGETVILFLSIYEGSDLPQVTWRLPLNSEGDIDLTSFSNEAPFATSDQLSYILSQLAPN